MSTRTRIEIGLVVVLIALAAFLPELYAGGWHLLHGNSVVFQQWKIPVPRGWFGVARGEGVALERLRRFNFWGTPSSALFLPVHFSSTFRPDLDSFEAEQTKILAEKGFQPAVRRDVTVNGKPGCCWEYEGTSDANSLWVACYLPEAFLSMDYRGPRKYVASMYRALAGISAAKP